MTRSKTILIALGGMAAGAIVATGITGMALAAGDSPAAPQVSTSTETVVDGPMGDHMDSMMGDRSGGMHQGIGSPVHGVMVAQDSSGAFVTIQSVHGTVSAVSATSITVKAADGFTATFAINADTRVHAKDATGSITGIVVGDEVMVMGTGSGTALTAVHIGSGDMPGRMHHA